MSSRRTRKSTKKFSRLLPWIIGQYMSKGKRKQAIQITMYDTLTTMYNDTNTEGTKTNPTPYLTHGGSWLSIGAS